MQALILAGGKGTRLRPYTAVLPKPLMPIGDYPILEIILRQLKAAGCDAVILAVGHMSHLFETFFADGKRYDLDISYAFEEKPLGTAGPIGALADRLEDNFLVMNGDLLTTIDYSSFFQSHLDLNSAATIAMYRREVNIDYGVIETTAESVLDRYVEKPTYTFDVSMGIYAMNKNKVGTYVSPGKHLDIPQLMINLSQDNHKVHCRRQDCQWLDIGRVDDFQHAIEQFNANPERFLPEC